MAIRPDPTTRAAAEPTSSRGTGAARPAAAPPAPDLLRHRRADLLDEPRRQTRPAAIPPRHLPRRAGQTNHSAATPPAPTSPAPEPTPRRARETTPQPQHLRARPPLPPIAPAGRPATTPPGPDLPRHKQADPSTSHGSGSISGNATRPDLTHARTPSTSQGSSPTRHGGGPQPQHPGLEPPPTPSTSHRNRPDLPRRPQVDRPNPIVGTARRSGQPGDCSSGTRSARKA